jgi:hypothetical protein
LCFWFQAPGSRFRAPSYVQLYRDVSDGARNNEKDAPGDEIGEVGILWRQFSLLARIWRGLAAAFTLLSGWRGNRQEQDARESDKLTRVRRYGRGM